MNGFYLKKFSLKSQFLVNSNIKELQERLKIKNTKSLIRNAIFQIFNNLDQYYNENSKHRDGDIDEYENEYLIYQTALLMRYVHLIIKCT